MLWNQQNNSIKGTPQPHNKRPHHKLSASRITMPTTSSNLFIQRVNNLASCLNQDLQGAQTLYYSTLFTPSVLISIISAMNPTSFHFDSSHSSLYFPFSPTQQPLLKNSTPFPKTYFQYSNKQPTLQSLEALHRCWSTQASQVKTTLLTTCKP